VLALLLVLDPYNFNYEDDNEDEGRAGAPQTPKAGPGPTTDGTDITDITDTVWPFVIPNIRAIRESTWREQRDGR